MIIFCILSSDKCLKTKKNRHEQQGQVVTTAIHCVNKPRGKYNNFISEWYDNTEPEAV